MLSEMFDQFNNLRMIFRLTFCCVCLESHDSKRSVQGTEERAQRTMRKGGMPGEMFDGVVKQMKHYAL